MISKMTITYFLLMIVLIDLVHAKFTEVPPPPKRPERFHSREELKRYLQKVHEYHLIVGRWRLRRAHDVHPVLNTSNTDLFHFFDVNNDDYITSDEFNQRLTVKKAD